MIETETGFILMMLVVFGGILIAEIQRKRRARG